MLLWAWVAPSVWAIVAGMLTGGVLGFFLSHTIVPGPRMELRSWERTHFDEIIQFGRWIVISSFRYVH